MEAWDTQNSCLRQSESPPVFRRKRSQTKRKKGKFVLEKPKIHKKKAKQVSSDKGKKSERIKRKRIRAHELYADVEAKFTVMEKAERVFTSLAIETPFFLKCMLPSNVTYSFWLIIPKGFCNNHLPSQDSTITLVDEWGKEYKTTYLMDRHGLSAGWRGFSMSHGLLKGDILIFNLIEPCRFMVHIVRVYALDVVNAALCLMNMDAFGLTTESDLAKQDNKKRKRTKKYAETTVLDAPRKPVKVEEKCNVALASTSVMTPVDQSETCSDNSSCSEVLQGGKTDHAIKPDHHYPKTAFIHERPYEGVRCM